MPEEIKLQRIDEIIEGFKRDMEAEAEKKREERESRITGYSRLFGGSYAYS